MAPWNFLDAPSTGIREVRSDEPGCLLHPQLPPQDPSLSSHRGGQNKELVTGQLCARLFPLLGRQQSARPARSRTSHLQGLVAAVRKVTWIPVCWDGFNSNGEKKYSFFFRLKLRSSKTLLVMHHFSSEVGANAPLSWLWRQLLLLGPLKL